MNLIQLDHSIFAIARDPIRHPDVGTIRFVNASPSWNATTAAFQLGDAFTNLIVPTSGCLIGSLAIAKIEWSNWIKFMWKFLGVLMIGAIITILIAVGIGF